MSGKKAMKTALELTKGETCLAAEFYYSTTLKMTDNKSTLSQSLLALMTNVADCPTCDNGPCVPDTHIFNILAPPFKDPEEVEEEIIPTLGGAGDISQQSTSSDVHQQSAGGGLSQLAVGSGVSSQTTVTTVTTTTTSTTTTTPSVRSGLPYLPPPTSLAPRPPLYLPHAGMGPVPSLHSRLPYNVAPQPSSQFTSLFPSAPQFTPSTDSMTSGSLPSVDQQIQLLQTQQRQQQEELRAFTLHQQQVQQQQTAQQSAILQELKMLRSSQPVPTHPLHAAAPLHGSCPPYPPLAPPPPLDGYLHHGSGGSRPVGNTEMARSVGISVGRLRTLDPNDPYSNKYNRKIVTGEHSSLRGEIQNQVLWPHHALDDMVVPVPPDYANLTPIQFAAGEVAIILSELPTSLNHSPIANRLRHFNRLFTHAMSHEWSTILSFHASFMRSIEQAQSTWDSWPIIKEWHDRHLDVVKLKPLPSKNNKEDKESRDGKESKDEVCGVKIGFIKSAQLCVKYQSNLCDQEDGHTSPHGKAPLSHQCAYCLFTKKVVVKHRASECTERKKVFGKGGAGAGKGST